MVQMGPKLNNELALRHTHHLTLYSCQPPLNNADPQKYFAQFKDGNCFSGGYSDDIGERRFDAYKDCSTIIYSWAIGGNVRKNILTIKSVYSINSVFCRS